MKRFLLFMNYNYYPSGGMGDYIADYDTWQSCILHKNENEDYISWPEGWWWQVLDTVTWSVISDKNPADWIEIKKFIEL